MEGNKGDVGSWGWRNWCACSVGIILGEEKGSGTQSGVRIITFFGAG